MPAALPCRMQALAYTRDNKWHDFVVTRKKVDEIQEFGELFKIFGFLNINSGWPG
jgi:uncharacterized ferritin-like protein (DUF455 family)